MSPGLRTAAILGLLSASAWAQVEASYQTITDWGSGFTGQISLVNHSAVPVLNWALEFDWDRRIDLIWNGRLVRVSGNHYTIAGMDWNSSIPAGGSVTVGFNGSPGQVVAGPKSFILSTDVPPPSPGAAPPAGTIKVTIAQTARWEGGFTANLTVANTGNTSVNGWNLAFTFTPTITSMWNASFRKQGAGYVVSSDASTAVLSPQGSVFIGLTGTGELTADSAADCSLNGSPCSIETVPAGLPARIVNPIRIDTIDGDAQATQFTIAQGETSYRLQASAGSPVNFAVSSNSAQIVTARIIGTDTLVVAGRSPGRASLRIQDLVSGAERFIGVRVRNTDGTSPGLPNYLALGSVSEDTPEHLEYWRLAHSSGRPADIRYIYLNGGPYRGWNTWGDSPASRAVNYLRNSRMMGLIPFFVFYNIPDDSESYQLDLAHVQDAAYLSAYFRNLKLALDAINQESPDDVVGMIIEPDFLGYLAQNDPRPPSAIPAITRAAYESGVLSTATDPVFGDSVEGFVAAVNYTISKFAPQVAFGWQMNLWASPARGWTTSVPGRGVIRKTDDTGVAVGRPLIYAEAAAITRFYLNAGVARYGASFLSIDKYGLDATGFEQFAAVNPAASTWFWNNDHWQNYLTFVKAIHDVSTLPVVLWQLPVGHINSTQENDPRLPDGKFPDLANTFQSYEDSAPSFFFGDRFATTGRRFDFFSSNEGKDPSLKTEANGAITWESHMKDAAAAGVSAILFGAGVGASTTNIGSPPSDGYWWTTKAQTYLQNPEPRPKP